MTFKKGPSVINKSLKKYSNSLKDKVSNKSVKFPFYYKLQPQNFQKRKSSAKTLGNNIKISYNDSFISKSKFM